MEMPFQVELIDVFSLILCLGVIYNAVTAKLVREFWKVLGLLLGMLAAFHFYSFLGEKSSNIPLLNEKYLDSILFLVIFLGVRGLFGLAGFMISLFFKKEEVPRQKWVALASGVFRSMALVSVVLFALQLSPLDSKFFRKSFSHKTCGKIAPETYVFVIKALSDYNPDLFAINENFNQQYKG